MDFLFRQETHYPATLPQVNNGVSTAIKITDVNKLAASLTGIDHRNPSRPCVIYPNDTRADTLISPILVFEQIGWCIFVAICSTHDNNDTEVTVNENKNFLVS